MRRKGWGRTSDGYQTPVKKGVSVIDRIYARRQNLDLKGEKRRTSCLLQLVNLSYKKNGGCIIATQKTGTRVKAKKAKRAKPRATKKEMTNAGGGKGGRYQQSTTNSNPYTRPRMTRTRGDVGTHAEISSSMM